MNEELLVNRVESRTSGVPGRSLNSARTNHFVIDEPKTYGGPGEAMTPAEAFLAGVSACGVLLVETFAREEQVALGGVVAETEGIRLASDPANFREVRMRFRFTGTERAAAERLVDRYTKR